MNFRTTSEVDERERKERRTQDPLQYQSLSQSVSHAGGDGGGGVCGGGGGGLRGAAAGERGLRGTSGGYNRPRPPTTLQPGHFRYQGKYAILITSNSQNVLRRIACIINVSGKLLFVMIKLDEHFGDTLKDC